MGVDGRRRRWLRGLSFHLLSEPAELVPNDTDAAAKRGCYSVDVVDGQPASPDHRVEVPAAGAKGLRQPDFIEPARIEQVFQILTDDIFCGWHCANDAGMYRNGTAFEINTLVT